jgi:hypothetical protein
MAWDSKFIEFGVAKVEGDKVKVYKDKFTYTTLSIGKPVKYAIWTGSELTVYLIDGKVRKYKDVYTYTTF